LSPELSAAEQEKLLDKIQKQITDSEGKASQAKDLGKKNLATPIKKQTEGAFYLMEFSAPVTSLSSLSQKLLLEEKILRYLVISRERGEEEAPKEKKTKKVKEK